MNLESLSQLLDHALLACERPCHTQNSASLFSSFCCLLFEALFIQLLLTKDTHTGKVTLHCNSVEALEILLLPLFFAIYGKINNPQCPKYILMIVRDHHSLQILLCMRYFWPDERSSEHDSISYGLKCNHRCLKREMEKIWCRRSHLIVEARGYAYDFEDETPRNTF